MIVGIDGGLSGAISWFDPQGQRLRVNDMPTLTVIRGKKNRREIDGQVLRDLLDPTVRRIDHVFLELAGPRPDEGAMQSFQFGQGYGIIRGILVAFRVPYTLVHPAKWKKALNVPADKKAARSRASQLLPKFADSWAIHRGFCNQDQASGRAEASLIAYWGTTYGGLPMFQKVVA